MIKRLGHLFGFVFGGKRPLPASAAVMVGATQQDLDEAPPASADLLRRAMDAASEPSPDFVENPVRPEPLPEPQMTIDPLPSLFLHGPTAEFAARPQIEPVPEAAEIAVSHLESISAEEPEPVHSWLTQEWVEIDLVDEAVTRAVSTQSEHVETEHMDPAREALVEEAFQLAKDLLQESVPADLATTIDEALPEPFHDQLPHDAVVESMNEVSKKQADPKKPAAKRAPAKKKVAASKRKKSASDTAVASLPDDAVFLTDAVVWSQCGSWREFWLPPTDANSSQRLDEFRQMAASGKLTIWGLAADGQSWIAIAPAHWEKYGFDPLSFLAGRENAFTQTKAGSAKSKKPAPSVKFTSLRVSRAHVEELWRSDAARAVA